MLIGIGVLFRVAVASVLALSACWKLFHSRSFARAFAGFAPARVRPFGKGAAVLIAAVEFVLAAILLVGLDMPEVRFEGPLAALALLIFFSVIVARAKGVDECGCWAMPFVDDSRRARRLLLVRNGLLLAMLAFAAALPTGLTGAAVAAATPAGMVLAAVTVELPQIVAVATFRPIRTVEE